MSLALVQRGSPIQTIGLPRSHRLGLAIATATVLGLHAGLLLFRPDASGVSRASAARAMAVRLLPAKVAEVAAPREPAVNPSPPLRPDREQVESAKAVLTTAGDSRSGVKTADRVPVPAARVEPPSRIEQAAPARSATPSPANAALAPEPDYLFGARLDPGPRPLGDIQPEYPESANLQEGKVVLRLLISATGVVDNAAVVRAEPKGLFEDAALEAFRAARFSPGMVLGTPVKSQITVEVEFLPINRGAKISGRMY